MHRKHGIVSFVTVCGLTFLGAVLYLSSGAISPNLPTWHFGSFGLNFDHPIDYLVVQANKDFEELISQQTNGVSAAAATYRKRRGRHPPPGFDKWVAWAEERDSVMIEAFFDQIYEFVDCASLDWMRSLLTQDEGTWNRFGAWIPPRYALTLPRGPLYCQFAMEPYDVDRHYQCTTTIGSAGGRVCSSKYLSYLT